MVRDDLMTGSDLIPSPIPNWINDYEEFASSKKTIIKFNPADGTILCEITASGSAEVQKAVDAAEKAQPAWAVTPPVRRGEILHDLAIGMKKYRSVIAKIVHLETGKSMKDALGETDGAIQCALFFAGEGQRMYGKTCTSGMANKYAMTIRQPIGVAGLIIAANTPVANVAWKVFPALICGNATILKAAKDSPATSWMIGKIAHETGLPPGLLNIIQGRGEEAGSPIVEHKDIGVISFTGSLRSGGISQRLQVNVLQGFPLNLEERIPSWSVMMPTWKMPQNGLCFQHSAMRGSVVLRPAGLLFSIPYMINSDEC